MKPIAVPVVGGMVSSVILVLFVIPVIFELKRIDVVGRETLVLLERSAAVI